MKLNLLPYFLFCTGLLTITLPVAKADQAKPTVYVCDFQTRDREITATTRSLTDEFETALENVNKYNILERRSMDRLTHEAGKEQAITGPTDMSETNMAALKMKGAELLIVGEVFDDIDSGQISVTVTFESWDGEKHLIKEISIPRGKIADMSTREDAMDELVKKIVQGNAPVLKAESHSFTIEITKCQAQGEDVTIDLTVVNTDDLDRKFTMLVNQPTFLYDDSGVESVARYARVANHEGHGFVGNLLVSGIPVKCSLEFGQVPGKATTITRLILNMNGGGQPFSVTFKSIPIERQG